MTSYSSVVKCIGQLSLQRRNFSRLRRFMDKTSPDAHASAIGKTIYQSLKGRDLLTFDGYTRNDIFSLLWVTTEAKLIQEEKSLFECTGKRICLIWSNPVTKASVSHAGQKLNASLCSIHVEQLQKTTGSLEILGRSLGAASDIIFINAPSWSQSSMERFATGCTCPVVVISSRELSPALAYSELFTLYEKYGFLRRLIIACISPSTNIMLNTYFTLLPTIGMHLRYFTYNGAKEDQSAWEKGLKLSSRNNTEMKQFDNIHDTLYRSHCISTCTATDDDLLMIGSNSTTSSNAQQIILKDTKEMDLEWTLLQHDALKGLNFSQDLMKASEHNLIFNEIENQSLVFQAIVLAHTSDFAPKLPPPRFEGVD